MKTFARMSQALQESRYVVWIFIVFCIGFVISCFAFKEDYMSSYNSYLLFPTRKSDPNVITVIALLPQVGQIIFAFAFGNSIYKNERGKTKFSILYFIVCAILMLYDLGTDVYYKAYGMGGGIVWLFAFAESIVVFTIGSEYLMTTCIGFIFALFPSVVKTFGNMFASMVNDDDDDDPIPTRLNR